MLTRGQQLIAQKIVSWHPGAGGGQAWIKWGVEAIAQFRKTNGRIADLHTEAIRALWGSKDLKETKLLAAKSPAGEELLRCSIYYIGEQGFDRVKSLQNITSENLHRLFGHATMWARDVANLTESIGELPPDAIDLVREAARERRLHFPQPIDLQNRSDLVDAAEAILSLEHAINLGTWPTVLGSTLDDAEARATAEFLLRIAKHPGSRSGRDIAFKGIAYDYNRRALDGLELELFAIHILHVPAADSPARNQVRDRMIQIIDEATAKSSKSKRIGEELSCAAMVLVSIGDEQSISRIVQCRRDQPMLAQELFPPQRFEESGYEIDQRGRRRDLLPGFEIEFVKNQAPKTPKRLQQVEIFRPIDGKCDECGGRMLALFDILIDPQVHLHFPNSRRVMLPVCVQCSHRKDGFFSSLRCDNLTGQDLDAWPCSDASSLTHWAPARQFQQRDSTHKERAEAWLGGAAAWQQYVQWPMCGKCRGRMMFAGQVGAVGPSYYGFFCPDCLTSNVRVQYD
ncbi:MAG TPA: hypothetical protein VH370_13035 [Humisphaera sp.]|jgi:hypothetical protein|nr:hypothetical protein [Humisphaera sp.]